MSGDDAFVNPRLPRLAVDHASWKADQGAAHRSAPVCCVAAAQSPTTSASVALWFATMSFWRARCRTPRDAGTLPRACRRTPGEAGVGVDGWSSLRSPLGVASGPRTRDGSTYLVEPGDRAAE